jgi:hypothetical protein
MDQHNGIARSTIVIGAVIDGDPRVSEINILEKSVVSPAKCAIVLVCMGANLPTHGPSASESILAVLVAQETTLECAWFAMIQWNTPSSAIGAFPKHETPIHFGEAYEPPTRSPTDNFGITHAENAPIGIGAGRTLLPANRSNTDVSVLTTFIAQ